MPTPTGVRTMTPSELAIALPSAIRSGRHLCIWGEPGIGKSQVVMQVANRMYAQAYGYTVDAAGRAYDATGKYVKHQTAPWLRDIRAVLLDPVDLRGLPHVNGDGRAHWAIPEFLPRDGSGLVFLDELNRATGMVQNACLQWIQDGMIGEYVSPDEWAIVAACNHESDGGGVTRMSAALANRFTHIEMVPDLTDWCRWAVTAGIEPMVIAYNRYKASTNEQTLQKFDASAKAYPTPRAWHGVSDILKQTVNDAAMTPAIEAALIEGTVGRGAAMEFVSYRDMFRNLPNPDFIIQNPDTADVPADISVLYAISGALARFANVSNFERVLRYLVRLPRAYATCAINDATVRDRSLTAHPAYTTWFAARSAA